MNEILTITARILIGIGTGITISGGIVAFIAIIGIIPMMGHLTHTSKYFIWYENAIVIGIITGSLLSMWDITIPIPTLCIAIILFLFGVFIGVLIIALAEVLNVFPIINRRIKVRKGISFLILSLALGKLVGSLIYWVYPIFNKLME